MKVHNLDGLPGITLEGKIGSTGKRGCQVFFMDTLAPSIIGDLEEVVADSSANSIILIDTEETLEYYNTTKDPLNKEFVSGLENGYLFTITDAVGNPVNDVPIDNDYILRTSTDGTYLYLVTTDEVEDDSDLDVLADSSTGPKMKTVYYLWEIDVWKYSKGEINQSDLEVTVENINLPFYKWNGSYEWHTVPCVPKGYITRNDKQVLLPEGHRFVLSQDDEYLNSARDYLATTDKSICTSPVAGTVYSIETGKPIPNLKVVIRGRADVEGDLNDPNPHLRTITTIDTEDCAATTDKNGNFVVNNFSHSEFAMIHIYEPASAAYLRYAQFMWEGDITEGISIYMYSNPFASVNRDAKGQSTLKYGEEFSIVDELPCYDTSKTPCTTEDHKTVVDIDEEGNPVYETLEKTNYPLTQFIVESNLPVTEKKRIRIEAEYLSQDEDAKISTCMANLWKVEDGSEDERLNNDPSIANGRGVNFSGELNFDEENLRSFVVVIKDYTEGNTGQKYVSYVKSPQGKYNISLFAYYRTSAAAAKKIYLGSLSA